MNYYSAQKLQFPIIIADSSDSDILNQTRREIGNLYRNLEVDYRSYVPETKPWDKVMDALQRVDSEYAVLNADDDFIVPQSMSSALQFLQRHRDYSLVHGEAFSFLSEGQTTYGPIESVTPYPQRSIEHPSCIDRYMDHFQQYSTTFYSIHRTNQLVSNFSRAVSVYPDAEFGELLPSCLSIIQGKSKKLDVLYMLRQGDTAKHYSPIKKIPDWFTDQKWAGNYEYFIDCLSSELMKFEEIKYEQASNIVWLSFWNRYREGMIEFFMRNDSEYASLVADRKIIAYDKSLRGRFERTIHHIPGAPSVWRLLCPPAFEHPNDYDHKSEYDSEEKAGTGAGCSNLLPCMLAAQSPYYSDFMPIYHIITGN